MARRLIGLFAGFCVLFSALYIRIAVLAGSAELGTAAAAQSSYVLSAGNARGQIYDCRFRRLVQTEQKILSAVAPFPETAAAVLGAATGKERERLYQSFQSGKPFLTDALWASDEAPGVTRFAITERYGKNQLAAHVIGYLDSAGAGVTGIEAAYNDFLAGTGVETTLSYPLNALGQPLQTESVSVEKSGDADAGVVLTIDREIQAICETVGERSIPRGAIVVMEPTTGKLLACASFPSYDPENVAASLEDDAAPLMNHCFSAFSVGSTFKTVLAAAALEAGIPASFSCTCTGWVDVKGQPFRCHLWSGHGTLDLAGGLKESCNPYFIALGQELGVERIIEMAKNLSFGRESVLAEGLVSSGGVLPAAAELPNPADLANLSFGQGSLMATPVQLARMMSAVANGGKTPPARLVEGLTEDGETLSETVGAEAPAYAMGAATAATLRKFLVASVEESDTAQARPTLTDAGGKTGTAQTGRYDDEGQEYYNAWFTGFFPAEEPKYVVTVLVENGKSGNTTSGPIFAEIADRITVLEQIRKETGSR